MAALLFGLWLVLNGGVTWEIAIVGAIATMLIMAFAARYLAWPPRTELRLYAQLPRAACVVLIIILEIVKANFAVMRVVYLSRPEPVIRVIKTRLRTRMARAVYANSITLTPGTITLELSGDEITVHCLTREMARGLEHSRVEDMLCRMEAGFCE